MRQVPHLTDMQPLLNSVEQLRQSQDPSVSLSSALTFFIVLTSSFLVVVFQLKAIASQLSLRQMLRIARRLSRFPDNNMYDTVHKACLGRSASSLPTLPLLYV